MIFQVKGLESLSGVLEVVGFFFITVSVLKHLIPILYKLSCLPFKKSLIQTYGADSWVIITGGSDGIGKGFGEELASQGFNIILVARNKSKLDNVANDIKKSYPNTKTLIITIDFKEGNKPEAFKELLEKTKNLNVSILINNVGTDILNHFHHTKEQELIDLIVLNTFSVVVLTRAFIPRFLDRKERCAIINLASVAGTRPMPYFSLYSGTKTLINFFTQALAVEYPNIDIMVLKPHYVSTPLTHNKQGFDSISPRECAQGALGDLGYRKSTFGHWKHKIAGNVVGLLPDWLFNPIAVGPIKSEMNRRHASYKSQ